MGPAILSGMRFVSSIVVALGVFVPMSAQAALTGADLPKEGYPTPVKITCYAPGATGKYANIEGKFETSRPGYGGGAYPRTLDDVRLGKSKYVTLAGNNANIGKWFNMGTITYTSVLDGKSYTLHNVVGYVHDTGSAFNAGTCAKYNTCSVISKKFDVAYGNFTGKSDVSLAQKGFCGNADSSWTQIGGRVDLPNTTVTEGPGLSEPARFTYSGDKSQTGITTPGGEQQSPGGSPGGNPPSNPTPPPDNVAGAMGSGMGSGQMGGNNEDQLRKVIEELVKKSQDEQRNPQNQLAQGAPTLPYQAAPALSNLEASNIKENTGSISAASDNTDKQEGDTGGSTKAADNTDANTQNDSFGGTQMSNSGQVPGGPTFDTQDTVSASSERFRKVVADTGNGSGEASKNIQDKSIVADESEAPPQVPPGNRIITVASNWWDTDSVQKNTLWDNINFPNQTRII